MKINDELLKIELDWYYVSDENIEIVLMEMVLI